MVGDAERSRRLAAKPKVANPALQAQKVLVVKLGIAEKEAAVDTELLNKFESTFATPLSESKHEAFRVLFQDDTFLDDFARMVDGILPGAQ